eukprot:scaffold355566_cov24-Attheya_sp.AAC.1
MITEFCVHCDAGSLYSRTKHGSRRGFAAFVQSVENGIERIDGNWKFGYGGYLFEVGDIGSGSFELSKIAVIHLIQLE